MHYLFISREEDLTLKVTSSPLDAQCTRRMNLSNKMHTNELSHALTDFEHQHFHLIFFFQLQLHFFFPVANRAAPIPDARGGRTHTMENIEHSCVTRMKNQFNNLLHLACKKR
jgi:hypothetical protein